MTAIGFLILVVLFLVAGTGAVRTESEKPAAIFALVVGCGLVAAGLAMWLWRVMP